MDAFRGAMAGDSPQTWLIERWPQAGRHLRPSVVAIHDLPRQHGACSGARETLRADIGLRADEQALADVADCDVTRVSQRVEPLSDSRTRVSVATFLASTPSPKSSQIIRLPLPR